MALLFPLDRGGIKSLGIISNLPEVTGLIDVRVGPAFCSPNSKFNIPSRFLKLKSMNMLFGAHMLCEKVSFVFLFLKLSCVPNSL